MSDTGYGSEDALDLFEEPTDYYKPAPQPTSATHILRSGNEIHLQLVGHNPLWGHLLWNAGRTMANYLEDHASRYIDGRNVLELGAGAGLPSLICAIRGAKKVVVTDYPDADLIENLRHNIRSCALLVNNGGIEATGFVWGSDVRPLKDKLLKQDYDTGFQTLLLADLLFNHSEHAKLIKAVEQTLQKCETARALVFFTPYRPWLLDKDLAFFDLAQQAGFKVEKLLEQRLDKVMFEDDPGDETLRRTVFGYEMTWQAQLWGDVQSRGGDTG